VAKLSDGVRRVLFLSRIHPKKGLADLVLAWGQVRQPGWQVVIAGPDEGGYEAVIRGLIKRHGLEADFDFPGVVAGERKERLFAEADIFILPTYSENFGIAVAEALARAVPVITTTGAPWQELETCECGWWVAPGVNGVAVALAQAMRASADTLAEMGARGRSLVEAKYAWARIGKEALRASEWALHRTGSKPECIDLV
jgi:glycosyltransferase involved in cell wall biosynthesis